MYATPVGDMPGAMVIVNAIDSLRAHGQLAPPSLMVKLLVEALLIILMSLVFARFSSVLGLLVSGAAVLVLLIPFSFYFFQWGVWVDFSLPLLAVQLHEVVAEVEEYRKDQGARIPERAASGRGTGTENGTPPDASADKRNGQVRSE